MPEPTGADLTAFTGGRLTGTVAQQWVDRALAAARAHCGWRVSYTEADEVEIDGPGGALLRLPTMHLVGLVSVTENGVDLDPDTDLWVSKDGMVTKRSGAGWADNFGAITVVMNHGLDDDAAAGFNLVVLEAADASSRLTAVGERTDPGMIRRKIDDVEYQWSGAGGGKSILLDVAALDKYCLEPAP